MRVLRLPTAHACPAVPPPRPPAAEEARKGELRTMHARVAARRDLLQARVAESQARLKALQVSTGRQSFPPARRTRAPACVQSALSTAAAEAAVLGDTRQLEAAVARAAERCSAMREALAGDENALAARLSAKVRGGGGARTHRGAGSALLTCVSPLPSSSLRTCGCCARTRTRPPSLWSQQRRSTQPQPRPSVDSSSSTAGASWTSWPSSARSQVGRGEEGGRSMEGRL